MNIQRWLKALVKNLLKRFQFDIVPSALVFDWQTGEGDIEQGRIFLPPEARSILTLENPILRELKERYQGYSEYPAEAVTIWTPEMIGTEEMLYFRGHNAYLFQLGRFNRNFFGYLLSYYYVKSRDRSGLLTILEEDGAFGATSYLIDGRQVSRDLLDSILEIYFLDEQLGIMSRPGLRVLDIGAGYGRLAVRMAEALPNLDQYLCADAFPVSTFLADYYIKYRAVDQQARSIPLDQIRNNLSPGSVDLALSIHSFSECALPAIRWWVELLAENEVPALMIIPNSKNGLLTNEKVDFAPVIEEAGYHLVAEQPKYQDPALQKYGLSPAYYYHFQLS